MEHYANFAATSRSLATHYEVKAKTLAPLEKDLRSKMKFVEKSRLFVADVKVFFSTILAIVPVLTAKAFSENPRPMGEWIIFRVV